MRKSLLFVGLIVMLSYLSFSQKSFLTYYETSSYQYAPDAAFKYGLYGFENPSILNTLLEPDLLVAFTNKNYGNGGTYQPYGAFFGLPHFAIGAMNTTDGHESIGDDRLSISFGDNTFGIGFGYGFISGRKSYFKRSNTFQVGSFWRPLPYFSLGLQFTQAMDNHDQEYVGELGIRPIKNYPLTFFADGNVFQEFDFNKSHWSAGVSYEFLDGVRLNGRYFDTKAMSVGFDFSFGKQSIGVQGNFSDSKTFSHTTVFLRAGATDRTLLKHLYPQNKFLLLDLSGTINYQRHAWFDDSETLLSILNAIDNAKKNNEVDGLVVNATNINASMEILWEIREKLKDFKSTGKRVYIYIDRAGLELYHFASVADKIIMDNLGDITLEGYMLGRSFYKQLLEKSGIGFDEIRLFKYKSAVENFSREKMSDADREQRQKIVDDWYNITKSEICKFRKISEAKFDSLVNSKIIYSAKYARENNLVDTTGRWSDATDMVKNFEGSDISVVGIGEILNAATPIDDKWGERKKNIAIVYAIGECAMDQGIKARSLSKVLKAVLDSKDIDAVVLRVDSPGGDALASDYISEIMKNNKSKKPIIVSQGMVAGSGGYWLSMYGDKIVASPMTITGSIGVISGRIFDKGLKDKLGITVDMVKAGKYVDAEQSFALPFIGLGLPVRDYTDDERAQVVTEIQDMYKDFVDKVADGRKMKSDSVGIIAQGRIWSGEDGKKNGLVDDLGGMEKAVQIAKSMAKIPEKEDVNLLEYPEPSLFDLSMLLPSLISMNLQSVLKILEKPEETTGIYEYLKFRAMNNDRPMLIMPIEYQDLVPKQ